ncbi:MAG: transporter substrate-binding protein [Nocardioides sp.]|jgi:multiple sugar transport system substrate-binding protein|uniref:ABC transporter substrate-binding protein n=1 Tax=Nocardioides sp. TaxID=35761 RepID=UPI0026143DF0|nr:ABC transporter substrate-binding protein [Nocardioides sp.]MCW2833739.1 transporter substrate-binding protein [Nocardioides sp.]
MSTPFHRPASAGLTIPLNRRNFLLLGSTAALVTGCGGGSGVGGPQEDAGGEFTGTYDGPPITLDYWNGFTGGDGPTMLAMTKEFADAQKNIDIKNTTIQWADFYQKLPAAAQAGKGPAVGVMHLDQVASNAARGILVPLDDIADEIGLAEEDFLAPVWSPGIYNEKRYGIPLDVHSLAMYWNKEHFDKAGIDEPPTDAASFDEACKKLQAAGYKTPFWMPNRWPSHLMFFSLIWQHGGEPFADDGSEATFGSEAGVAALTWMREQVDKGYSPENVDIDAQYLAFKNGENSITWDGIWQINDLKEADMDYGMAPIPTIGEQPAVWANSHHFFMTSQAAEDKDMSDASKLFISELSQNSGRWAEAAMIPARNSAREDASYTDSPQAALDDQLENFRFLPSVPGVADTIAPTLEVAVNEAILGKASPQEALEKYQAEATELMQENLEKFGG